MSEQSTTSPVATPEGPTYRQRVARPDGKGGIELRCSNPKCRAWKPDWEFPPLKNPKSRCKRGSWCRACSNALRAECRRQKVQREREEKARERIARATKAVLT